MGFIAFAFVFIFYTIFILVYGSTRKKDINYQTFVNNNVNTGGAFSPIMYNQSLKDLANEVINGELTEHGFGPNDSTPSVERRKSIIAIIYSIVMLVVGFLFVFRINIVICILLAIVATILFFVSIFKVSLNDMIYKEFNSRPDENMEYIISAYIQNKTNRIPFMFARIIVVLVCVCLPFIIYRTPKFYYEKTEGGYSIRFYAGYQFPEEIVVPDTYNGEPIVGIRGNVFKNIKTVRSIKLPDTITEINGHAFEKDTMLEKIKLPNNLKYIGAYAFNNCGLVEVTIPEGVNSIEPYTFANNKYLKTVTVNNPKISIESHAFYNAFQLTKIANTKVNYVGANAFESTGDVELEFSDNIEEIKEAAFKGSKISKITLPKNLKKIGPSAFESSGLKEITFNNKLEEISEAAFKASKITSAVLPDSVVRISAHAFRDCDYLTRVVLPSKLTEIRTSTFRNTAIANITIPESVTTIGENAFRDCYSLTIITIPRTLRTIGEKAFRNCTSLKEITIPKGCSVGSKAFDGTTTRIKFYN